jgi:hypothetical protein
VFLAACRSLKARSDPVVAPANLARFKDVGVGVKGAGLLCELVPLCRGVEGGIVAGVDRLLAGV